MTTKIVDIAYEIFEELGEPTNISIPSIAFWLRANLPKLNLLIDKNYSIGSNLEIEPSRNQFNAEEPFTLKEKSILQKMYMVSYYERLFRNALGAASVDSVVSVTDDGSTVVKINKNEIAKNYSQLKNQTNNDLLELVKIYNLNQVNPKQVAGDDTIIGHGEFGYNYLYRRGL